MCITATCDWQFYYNNMNRSVICCLWCSKTKAWYHHAERTGEAVLKKSTGPWGEQKEHPVLCRASQLVKWAVASPSTRMARGHSWESIPLRKHSVFSVLASHSIAFSGFIITRKLLCTIIIFFLSHFQGWQIELLIVYAERVFISLFMTHEHRTFRFIHDR